MWLAGQMMKSAPDLQNLIHRVYEAAENLAAWPQPMAAMADALRARAVSLHVIGADGKTSLLTAPRTDPQWLRTFSERWSGTNLVRQRSLALPVGAIYRFEDLMLRSDFECTVFYKEFWAPQHHDFALFGNIANDREAVAGIGFYRSVSEGPFTSDEERMLRVLMPHLQHALSLNLRFRQIEMERDGAVEMLDHCSSAAFLVDHGARILQANAAAEALLGRGKALYGRSGRLAACDPPGTALLRAMIAGDTADAMGGKLLLRDSDGGMLSLQVWRVQKCASRPAGRAAAVIFAEELAEPALPSREQLRSLFGFTPAQASLALEILQGDGVEAAARRLGISRATARTHLLQCFQRTGTGRQAELVRVILQRAQPLRGHADPAP